MENKAELLAPVGCEENFYAAINYGANAVYVGLTDFSARKNAGNFTLEKLPYYIAYAHLFGVKIYVAVNTVIKNDELPHYFNVIDKAYRTGADAFIVQDVFLGRTLKKLFPSICLHLSTQAGINNLDGAKQAVAHGFSRVILARETPFEEIKKIAAIVETEVFVQGALCTCFSGHCYFSSFIGGKSGNRGLCRQPCRKLYKYEGKGVLDEVRYALSLSDLSLSKKVDLLITAGVKSFKIEGRMRSFEYVCASCDFYSEILEGQYNRTKAENLFKTYNRGGYTEGLCFGQDKKLISDKIQNHAGLVVGKVSSVYKNRLETSDMKYEPHEGDCFKIITDGVETGNAVATAENGKIVIKFRQKAYAGSSLSLTKDCALAKTYKSDKKLFEVNSRMILKAGQLPILIVNGVAYSGDNPVQKALNYPLTKSEIKDNLRKTDVYPFNVTPSCETDGDVFLPKKDINALRAKAYKEYFYSFLSRDIKIPKNEDVTFDFKNNYKHGEMFGQRLALISDSFDFPYFSKGKFDSIVFCPADYNDLAEFEKFFSDTRSFNGKRYLYCPPFMTSRDEKILSDRAEKFFGLYGESASTAYLAKRLGKEFFAGIELNLTNEIAVSSVVAEGADKYCVSKELSEKECRDFPDAFVLKGGVIKIMSLEYCPFGKKCADCKRGDRLVLKDESDRAFKVRRYKLSSCRFEVYNNAFLYSKNCFPNEIYDFTALSRAEKEKLSYVYFEGEPRDKDMYFTSGNLINGVE